MDIYLATQTTNPTLPQLYVPNYQPNEQASGHLVATEISNHSHYNTIVE